MSIPEESLLTAEANAAATRIAEPAPLEEVPAPIAEPTDGHEKEENEDEEGGEEEADEAADDINVD